MGLRHRRCELLVRRDRPQGDTQPDAPARAGDQRQLIVERAHISPVRSAMKVGVNGRRLVGRPARSGNRR